MENPDYINTEIDSADPRVSALAIYKQNMLDKIQQDDRRNGPESGTHQELKTYLLKYFFADHNGVIEAAFTAEQDKICGFLQDREFGLTSENYTPFNSQYAKRAFNGDIRKTLNDIAEPCLADFESGKAYHPEKVMQMVNDALLKLG